MILPLSASTPAPSSHRRSNARLATLAALVATADFLFFDTPWGGPAAALFVVLLVVAGHRFNPDRSDRRRRLVAVGLIGAALLALLARGEGFAVLLAGVAVGAAILLRATPSMPWEQSAIRLAGLPFAGWIRLPRDFATLRRASLGRGRRAIDWRGWALPIGLSLVFLVIFVVANPVVAAWVAGIVPRRLLGLDDVERLLFWFGAAATIRPLLRLGRAARAAPSERIVVRAPVAEEGLLGTAAMVRSLVAFNGLFALQTITDLEYLWAGAGLPAGMTHAEYAHRGAYPLMVAAMVAGGFVLLALRGGAEERRPVARILLLAFVVQGLMLVLSSMLRLELYVAAYSLTLWRLAAFVWMGLVAVGFGSILVRLLARRSNRWLGTVDAAATLLTLWGCCFVDEVDLVARWNVAHCAEVSGTGPRLDLAYLQSLGVGVVPALDAHREALAARVVAGDPRDPRTRRPTWVLLGDWRDETVRRRLATPRDWRTWSVADWRLDRTLSTMPTWSTAAVRRVAP